jgi:hypothetical protein
MNAQQDKIRLVSSGYLSAKKSVDLSGRWKKFPGLAKLSLSGRCRRR